MEAIGVIRNIYSILLGLHRGLSRDRGKSDYYSGFWVLGFAGPRFKASEF